MNVVNFRDIILGDKIGRGASGEVRKCTFDGNQYCIKIKGNRIATYSLMPTMVLCMDPMGLGLELEGIKAIEPSFGLEALWISKDKIEEAELMGYTIVDPSTILVTHLLEIVKENVLDAIHHILKNQRQYMDEEKMKKLISKFMPGELTIIFNAKDNLKEHLTFLLIHLKIKN